MCIRESGRIECTESNCGYGVHRNCVETLAKLNQETFFEKEFVCNHINYFLKPDEVATIATGNTNMIAEVIKNMQRRGEINYRNFTPKRKRYENPDLKCEKCGQIVGINEVDHELRYCSARYLGTPIPTRDYEYTASKFKRIRRCALYDYPP